jgi:CheY-like chemotaxis protein
MTEKRRKGIGGFLREAKRRKVYVSAVGYVGVSVVLMEITGPVSEALLLPDWTSRLVTFLLILGFPVVLVLAWTFDLTGTGVVRTTAEDDRTSPGPMREKAKGARTATQDARASFTSRLRVSRPPLPSLRKRRPRVEMEDNQEEGTQPDSELDPERVRRATVAHMRHELRTPINGIIGYSEMLLEDVEDPAFTGDLEKICGGGRQLLGLIDQILGEGALISEDQDLESVAEKVRVDLRTPVTSVIGYAEMLMETAQEEGRQEFMPDLERIKDSASHLLELSGDIVGLATGAGVDSSVQGLEATELTRTVLSKIQGRVADGGSEAEGRLLVVDDNGQNRDLLSRQLARQGYIVLTASNGAEALEVLETKTVDLILLDVIMPVMDGVETLRRLKSNEALEEIPVLMLSSLDEVDGALRCVEMGAEDFLSKPVKPAVLEARISANLDLYRMRERERLYQERAEADQGLIEELLLAAFPESVAARVQNGDAGLADAVPEATVLCCTLRGLVTPTSNDHLNGRLRELRKLAGSVEDLVREHGLEILIWRPHGFLAVAGAPSPVDDHAQRTAALGLALLQQGMSLEGPNGSPLGMGLGLHTGPVVGAALGGSRLRYEVWGEGVTAAEGVAAAADNGALLVSPTAHSRLKELYRFEPRQVMDIAGTQMRTYLLQNGGAPEEG